jgi:hypothetical protein
MSEHSTHCPYHVDHENRINRNEQDIQTQFAKIGEALGLMHKVDKRLEGLYGKITGISAVTGTIIVLIPKILDWLVK